MQTGSNTGTEKVILLVEDNPADLLLIEQAFARLEVPARVMRVKDGEAALKYLSGLKPYSNRKHFPLPKLVLLDLRLPVFDGFHVLEWIRTEPFLRRTPVIILTASCNPEEMKRAYAFGASSFITKSSTLSKLAADLKLALDYWLDRTPEKPSVLIDDDGFEEQREAA